MKANVFKQLRAARAKALADGTATVDPKAFYWEDPTLTTAETSKGFEIYFNDLIDDWFGISSAMVVEALQAADGRDVLVHVNSPGGMVFEGLSIYSAFKQYEGKVTMRVEGLAASAASFVICAGDEVLVEPGAMIMIHDAWNVTVGDAADHRKEADVLDKVSNSIANIYATRAGTEQETWRAAMIEETWYGSDDAVAAGLADSVVGAGETASATGGRGPAARWSGIFSMPTEWGGEKPADPEPTTDAPPLPDPEPEPPAAEPGTENLAALLSGYDLSAALRTAFDPRGVPA